MIDEDRVRLLDGGQGGPAHLRDFSRDQLGPLTYELRRKLIEVVSITGGRPGASLGVVALVAASHHFFDACSSPQVGIGSRRG